MSNLSAAERRLLCDLVTCALENRSSAILDLTQQSRRQLYVLYAKLSGALEESEASGATSVSERFPRPVDTIESR